MTTAQDQATLPAQGTETETLPGDETQVEAAEATDSGAADTTESGDDSTTEGKEHAETEVEKLRRKTQRRIDRLTAEKGAAQERIRALEAAAEAKANEGDDTKPADDPRDIANQLVLARDTAATLAKVTKEAKAKYPDFEAKVAELVAEIGPQISQKGIPSPLMQAVLDSDRAAEILHYLGDEPEFAAELVGLSPAKIGRRIAKLEDELAAKAKPKTSAAAKPLTPVKPSAVTVVDQSKLTDAQWAKLRKQQRLAA